MEENESLWEYFISSVKANRIFFCKISDNKMKSGLCVKSAKINFPDLDRKGNISYLDKRYSQRNIIFFSISIFIFVNIDCFFCLLIRLIVVTSVLVNDWLTFVLESNLCIVDFEICKHHPHRHFVYSI
jgi:hypothetical protein